MTDTATHPPAIVVHGGAGAPLKHVDGCQAAADAASVILRNGGEALDAVVRAVAMMEDDGRFNAGSGAVMGMDGATIEMDAAIMDSRGRLGCVACIQRVRNPVAVARAIADSPHRFLCGEGAERFARVKHMAAPLPVREEIRRRREQAILRLIGQMDANPALRDWNYPGDRPQAPAHACDTVGAVARDAQGHFAVAGSTGGVFPALMGRVGDTPVIGAGFFAGPNGAVAVTGTGERVIPLLLAHTVYQWIADGIDLDRALARGVALFPAHVEVGLIAVSRSAAGSATNCPMPIVRVEA